MLWPFFSLEGSSEENTHLKEISYYHIVQIVAGRLQVGASSIKVQVQVLATNRSGNQVFNTIGRNGRGRPVLALSNLGHKLARHFMCGSQVVLSICLQHGCRAIADKIGIVNGGGGELRAWNLRISI